MNTGKPHERTFIRHPLDMPIEVQPAAGQQQTGALINLSLGGLAFHSREPYAQGTDVTIYVGCCDPPASVTGQVAWCEPEGDVYDVGVAFYSPADAYKMRMVEQACHIQQYRLERVIDEGRYMTLDEAAHEWIGRYARCFAASVSETHPRDNDESEGKEKPSSEDVRHG